MRAYTTPDAHTYKYSAGTFHCLCREAAPRMRKLTKPPWLEQREWMGPLMLGYSGCRDGRPWRCSAGLDGTDRGSILPIPIGPSMTIFDAIHSGSARTEEPRRLEASIFGRLLSCWTGSSLEPQGTASESRRREPLRCVGRTALHPSSAYHSDNGYST